MTLSLHHFEDDEMLGGYVHNEWVPSIRVDQLVISLKGVELYVLSLLVDSLRAVKGFHLDKAVRK